MTEFQLLYRKFSKDIYNYAYYLSGNRDDANDITSETFCRALLSKSPIKMRTVKAYLLTIARNYYLETLRLKKNNSELTEDLEDLNQTLIDNLDNKLEIQSIWKFISSFSEIDRSALFLKSTGFSYEEIASILDISISAAKVRVHRVRKKIITWKKSND